MSTLRDWAARGGDGLAAAARALPTLLELGTEGLATLALSRAPSALRDAALLPRGRRESESLRLALVEWRAHLIRSGRVERERKAELLVRHGLEIARLEAALSLSGAAK